MIINNNLREEHLEIKKAAEKYVAGDIKVLDLKKVTAKFGIYNTRDGKFMTRVRQVGGEFSVQKLKKLSEIMDDNRVSFAHMSTRDSIQLHGVPCENIYNIVKECTENEMPFKGGGGDCYRNPLVSPLSGISKETIFDVRPYALKTDEAIRGYDKAFTLGRKFKISFSSEIEDCGHTVINDLGFLAKKLDGKNGFLVYAGGGLGRFPALGNILFDFIPAEECIRATIAMVDIFHQYGERENRAKARLRFLVDKLGFEKFKNLYMEYFHKTKISEENIFFQEKDYSNVVSGLTISETETSETEEFKRWTEVATKETKFQEIFSVRLFIGKGDLKSDDIKKITNILDKTGCPFVRLTPEQDMYIPMVHKSFLFEIYQILKENFQDQGAVDIKFKDHVVTCIGASLCNIGLLDSQVIGKAISEKLDELFKKYSEYKLPLYSQLIDGIKISGCGSSCGVNQIAPLGFGGVKKNIGGKVTDCLQIFLGGSIDSESNVLSKTDPEKYIPISEAPEFVENIVEQFIKKLKNDKNLTFKKYMKQVKL